MKKLLSLLLVLVLTLSFVACGGDTDTDESDASSAVSQSDSSKSDDKSKDESKEESKDEASSDDTSSDTSEDETVQVEFTNKYISWGKHLRDQLTDVTADQSTSLKISKINSTLSEGDVGLYTASYGSTLGRDGQDFSDFAVAVFTYDHAAFSYLKTAFYAVGEAENTIEIPADGYVIAIHKSINDKIFSIKSLDAQTAVFPHGFTVNNGLDVIVSAAATAPSIDGNVTMAEYGAPVWDYSPDNVLINYSQFEVENYYASAKVYMSYDSTYLYLGVVVDSPYHSNPLAATGDVSMMWAHECIQVNVLSKGVNDDYVQEHWDAGHDNTAGNENVLRQYGFAANGDGDKTKCLWFGNISNDNSIASCKRDDGAGVTYYEAAIPWADCGAAGDTIVGESGTELAVSVSVNCGDGTKFKNISLRDGGGVIGINDLTKMPTITLG